MRTGEEASRPAGERQTAVGQFAKQTSQGREAKRNNLVARPIRFNPTKMVELNFIKTCNQILEMVCRQFDPQQTIVKIVYNKGLT